jgi:hypothetical protein
MLFDSRTTLQKWISAHAGSAQTAFRSALTVHSIASDFRRLFGPLTRIRESNQIVPLFDISVMRSVLSRRVWMRINVWKVDIEKKFICTQITSWERESQQQSERTLDHSSFICSVRLNHDKIHFKSDWRLYECIIIIIMSMSTRSLFIHTSRILWKIQTECK